MLGRAQSVLAFRVSLVLDGGGHQQHGRARAGLRGAPGRSARRARDARARRARAPRGVAPAPPERRRRAARARRVPRRRAAAEERARAPARWTPRSATNGFCWRSRSRPAMPDRLCSTAIPPEAFTHDDLRAAHAWVRARLNQDEAPSVQDVQRLEAELVALAARHGGPEALGEVAGRVESRWIERRLEPLKEKLAAAEITPEEMRELAGASGARPSAPEARTPLVRAEPDMTDPLTRDDPDHEHELSGSQLLGLMADS